jgi:hypothetical protein
MRISEIMPRHPDALRRVGIKFPTRSQAMLAACKLHRDFGLDVEIQENDVWYETVKPMGGPLMGMLERACGVRGFNEWETP